MSAASPSPATPTLPTPPPESALEQFLEQNFRKLIYALLAVVALIAVTAILRHRSDQAAANAAIAATRATTAQDCDMVIAAHPGTTAAGNALLKKASLLWEQNNKSSSMAAMREFTTKFVDHPFRLQGLVSLATRLQEMGELPEAKKIYEQVLADNPTHDLASLAQLRLGDILWQQGNEAEAKKLYEELPRKFPGSAFFAENATRLEWLGANLPTKEVDPPKPPPATIAAPTPGATAAKTTLPFDFTPTLPRLPPPNPDLLPKPKPKPPATPTATLTPSGSAATLPAQPKPAETPKPAEVPKSN